MMCRGILSFLVALLLLASAGLAKETRLPSQTPEAVAPGGVIIDDVNPGTLSTLRLSEPNLRAGWDYFERTKGFPVSFENVVKMTGTDARTGEAFEVTLIPFVNPRRQTETYNVLIYCKRGDKVSVAGGVLDVSQSPPVVREDYSFQDGQVFSFGDRLRGWAGCTADFCTIVVVGCKLAGAYYGHCLAGGCALAAAGCGVMEVVDWLDDRERNQQFQGPPPPRR
ncbi:MAG: hypothetical protein QME66_02510 [Candidatus Eisenbacteria bacterium]|nr:hypothetical protein [Candidatus Eisenbacteria bacterium]